MSTLLGERYRLGERLAAGGMGSVCRAVDERLGRPVAVKVLRRELAGGPAHLERFRREARALAAALAATVERASHPPAPVPGPGGRPGWRWGRSS